ncbi:hypothetical protein DCAR_0103861 [Daucus carota subsp. sativus]|uniref:Uncharacterized protein n=1 Tax=Daucus carota subsp. sativus TaxID=79200 RepID=A0A166ICL6_DAUCS|nr:hypothetical protein DCAR_0103861 [Daucus carota subsp. sativus]
MIIKTCQCLFSINSSLCSAVVDADVERISEYCGETAAQTCCGDGLELIDEPKVEELCYGSDVVETFDDAWINSIFDEENEWETMNSLLEKEDIGQASLD